MLGYKLNFFDILEMMEEQELEETIEMDIYFEGGKDQLYAILFPIAGANSPLFNHLELNQVDYDKNRKQLEFSYETKDFKNIDRQKQPIKYASTSLPSKSNYFYSYRTPQGLVWRNITKILQMRPTFRKQGQKQKKEQKNKGMEEESIEEKVDGKMELYRVGCEDEDNKIMQEIRSTVKRYEQNQNNIARRNWDINQKEYFMRLFE